MRKPSTTYRPYLTHILLLVLLFASAMVIERRAENPSTTDFIKISDTPDIPDFANILEVDLKKETFFDFLQPYIDVENNAILAQRSTLQDLLAKISSGFPLSRQERHYISAISEEYEVDTDNQFTVSHLRQLLRRIDIIPPSLVLAQAANESAWGTSRFAVEGNNYFGQWCYTEGCGLVPSRRRADASHEVRAFSTLGESVHAYFMNINTFPSYQKLRRIRQQLREQGREVDGMSLTEGLDSYSERGDAYVDELQTMIYQNELHKRDQA